MTETKSPARVYWLVGDPLLTEEKWRSLTGSAEVVRLDGKKLDVAALIGEIDTLPMFVDHKWILVQDFRLPGKRSGDGDGKTDPETEKGLLDALKRVGPAATVILVSEVGDRRTRLYRLVQETGQYLEFSGFKDYETQKIVDWIVGRMGALGKRIPHPLALGFVEAVGSDLSQLASEAEKLAIAMGEESVVTDRHLEVTAGSPVALRRLIEEGIVRKQPDRAQVLLRQTLAANEHPLRIVNFVIPRIRDLLRARLCPEGRRDTQRAVQIFGAMHPFRLKNLYEEADRFTAAELRGALHSLVLADTCLKSSVDGERILSLLVAALTGGIDHDSFARAVQCYVEPWD